MRRFAYCVPKTGEQSASDRRPMQIVNRKSEIVNAEWLPDMDLNHDKQIQSLLCYRYTIGQTGTSKVGPSPAESRLVKSLVVELLNR